MSNSLALVPPVQLVPQREHHWGLAALPDVDMLVGMEILMEVHTILDHSRQKFELKRHRNAFKWMRNFNTYVMVWFGTNTDARIYVGVAVDYSGTAYLKNTYRDQIEGMVSRMNKQYGQVAFFCPYQPKTYL